MMRRIDDFGIPNKAKEAASFALLAAATLDHVPGNLPAVTGAARPAVLGVVARP
jgi:anhydro-N-acetylmuramic acid kinase